MDSYLCEFSPQVCWSCRASKGSQDLDYCYVNVDPNAAWRGTIGLDPIWEHTPELSKLVGFSPLMISMDLFHIWHLGTGRDPCPICKSFTVFHKTKMIQYFLVFPDYIL